MKEKNLNVMMFLSELGFFSLFGGHLVLGFLKSWTFLLPSLISLACGLFFAFALGERLKKQGRENEK